ncbi:MAG TPA: hypothetical protein VNF07_02970 [Acidimicrobiales bacterium]|nr:hypothetical protein [Acidimicrobiales bacterium]
MAADPDAVRLCLYSDGHPSRRRPSGGVLLGGWPASALADLIVTSPTVRNPPRSCTNHDVDVLMEFAYPNASAGVVAVSAGCPEALVLLAGHARLLDKALAAYLTATAGSYALPGRRAPDLYAQPVGAAERNAEHAGFSVNFGEEEIDTEVPPVWCCCSTRRPVRVRSAQRSTS